MNGEPIPMELCRNCAELKPVGLPCLYCRWSSPNDAEKCYLCGDVKIIGLPCTSPNHSKGERP